MAHLFLSIFRITKKMKEKTFFIEKKKIRKQQGRKKKIRLKWGHCWQKNMSKIGHFFCVFLKKVPQKKKFNNKNTREELFRSSFFVFFLRKENNRQDSTQCHSCFWHCRKKEGNGDDCFVFFVSIIPPQIIRKLQEMIGQSFFF